MKIIATSSLQRWTDFLRYEPELVLGMTLRFYSNLAIGLKLKVREFSGLNPTMPWEVSWEKLVVKGVLAPLSSWIGLTQVDLKKTSKELLIAYSYNKMKLNSIQTGEEGTNLQSCSYYFETFWWFRKFFFRHKRNEAWLLVIKWYIRVASRVDEQLETLGNQELSRNSQNSIE